jgi:NAD-dependent DNA ligase
MSDIGRYFKFTGKSRLEKAVFTLVGILEGIAIDGIINQKEIQYLANWVAEQSEDANKHPFDELLPIVANSLILGTLSEEDRQDLIWLCKKFQDNSYFNEITIDMQRLHALMAGIAADGIITLDELNGLSDWLADHEHLRRCWPYDEIDSLITIILADQMIDAKEHALLMHFFSEFADLKPSGYQEDIEHPAIQGLCAAAPSIRFDNSIFCFTGQASVERDELEIAVIDRGGKVSKSITRSVNYLVIGAEGNPCWAYACYGRKVEQAVKLRKQGFPLVLVHEVDFFDAIKE